MKTQQFDKIRAANREEPILPKIGHNMSTPIGDRKVHEGYGVDGHALGARWLVFV